MVGEEVAGSEDDCRTGRPCKSRGWVWVTEWQRKRLRCGDFVKE